MSQLSRLCLQSVLLQQWCCCCWCGAACEQRCPRASAVPERHHHHLGAVLCRALLLPAGIPCQEGKGSANHVLCSVWLFPPSRNGSPNHQPEPPPPIADVSHTSELVLVVRMGHGSQKGLCCDRVVVGSGVAVLRFAWD